MAHALTRQCVKLPEISHGLWRWRITLMSELQRFEDKQRSHLPVEGRKFSREPRANGASSNSVDQESEIWIFRLRGAPSFPTQIARGLTRDHHGTNLCRVGY